MWRTVALWSRAALGGGALQAARLAVQDVLLLGMVAALGPSSNTNGCGISK
jgi:hypothetical protein